MASEEAIRDLMALTEGVFKARAIVQEKIRYDWCKFAIESGKLFDATNAKFDIQLLAGLTSKSDVVEQFQKNTYHLGVNVPNASLNVLQGFHPHLRIVNGNNPAHPHAAAQAQRHLDVRMMVRKIVSNGARCYIDIGGNYTTHPTLDIVKGIQIHCCTLRSGYGEWHRQTQRDVSVRNGAEETLKCRDGVENCTYTSEVGMCVHALPEIDPDLWPKIFRQHGLRRVDTVHHHPTDLDNHERKGFMPYPNMHWNRGDDDIVHFHFDSDPSLGYHHRYDYMQEYSRSWLRSEPNSEYVIYYQVDHMENGMLYSSLTRLKKAAVKVQPTHDKLLFTGGHDDIMVPVATFNPESGYSISDPNGYNTVFYPVPERIYNWAFFKGISNDTSNPGKSYTRNDMRQAIRTINRDRSLNAFAFSEYFVMDQVSTEHVADGIYTAIVIASAYNRMIIGKMTGQMQRMQRKWGHEGVLSLLTRTVTLTALLPYFLLAGEMQDAVDVLRLAIARGLNAHEFLAPPQRRLPYKVVGKMIMPTHIGDEDVDLPGHAPVYGETEDSHEFRKKYYETFKDHLTPEQREALESFLYPDGKIPTETVSGGSTTRSESVSESVQEDPSGYKKPTVEECDDDDDEVKDSDFKPTFVEDEDISSELPSREEAWRALVENREEWLRRFNALRDNVPSEMYLDVASKIPRVGTDAEVHEHDANALLEYALHCFDLHQSVHNNALENLSRHWMGTGPNHRNLSADEDKDLGIGFFAVDETGCMLNVPDGVYYDQVIDPYTREFLDVSRRRDGRMWCGKPKGDVVYTLDSLRVSNSKRIGLVAMRAYESGFDLSKVKFHLIDGIAGSGKTRTLTSTIDVTDIFATAPRASAKSVREWCKSQERFKGKEPLIEKQFRTMDSHNLYRAPRQGKRLFIDESFMIHDGAAVLLAIRSNASEVFMSGDNAQIGMIDRGAGYGDLLFSKRIVYNTIKYLNETERCPGDSTVLLRSFYPEWRRSLIKTRNPIRRSIQVEVHPNPEHPSFKVPMPTATYLTFTQNDKMNTAKNQGFVDAKKVTPDMKLGLESQLRPVMSVHESQGETFPNVVIHRLNKYSNATFDSKPHQYVSFSRHFMVCKLNTVCDASMCSFTRLMMRGVNVTEAEIDSVMSDDVPSHVIARNESARKVLEKYVNLG